MTNEELQAHIEALEEELEKGAVEIESSSGIWSVASYFKVGSYDRVRVKPKPLECWVNCHPERALIAFESFEAAHAFGDGRVVHMREVTE